jgi:hypothetical protein
MRQFQVRHGNAPRLYINLGNLGLRFDDFDLDAIARNVVIGLSPEVTPAIAASARRSSGKCLVIGAVLFGALCAVGSFINRAWVTRH